MRGWWRRRRLRRDERTAANDAHLAARWAWAAGFGHEYPDRDRRTCLGRVVAIRQYARTGTKAYVEWTLTGQVTGAAWFEGQHVQPGDIVVATGNVGYGPHHEEAVFYVGYGELTVIPADAPRAYDRHRARQQFGPAQAD